jgi:hypothetical protein
MVSDMAKRKLPVLNAHSADEDTEPRPPWHWVGFGAVLVFGAWMPLALLAQACVSRLSRLPPSSSPTEAANAFYSLSSGERAREIAIMAVPHALALAISAFAAGYVVARFGDRTGPRESAVAGFAAGFVAVLLAFASAGISWPPLVVLALAPLCAWLGGRRGASARAM